MSNPFQTIRETMQTHLVAGVTAAKWVDVYDGEDWKDEDFGQMRSRISAKGAGIYVRVVRTERDAEAPDSFDHHRLYLHVICAAAAVADRKRSAEAAEDLVWQAYQTVRAAGQSPTWLHEPWRLQGFTPEYQGANATIVSLLFASSADLAELETATYEPNAEVPDTGVSTIADQDRLSLWVQADGWVRRFITGANLQAQFAGGGGGGSTDVAAATHAAQAKSPLADNDEIPVADSAAAYGLKKVLWSVIKGTFALLAHGHTGTTDGSKLAQANTHESADTDNATTALHHTLGTAANQAAAGNHTHAGGGASRWTEIAAAHYTATPASTSTLTFGTDDTATLIVGLPVRYTIGGTVYYGQVTAIAANLLTVRGAPMGGDVTKLEVGTAEMVSQIHVQLPGLFEDASNATLLATDLYTKLYWERALSYCVGYSANVMTADGGANQANVQVYWGTNLVSTANTNTGPLVTVAKVATVVDINTTNYVVSTGELLEIGCTKGSTGDARDLTVEIVMVTP